MTRFKTYRFRSALNQGLIHIITDPHQILLFSLSVKSGPLLIAKGCLLTGLPCLNEGLQLQQQNYASRVCKILLAAFADMIL